MPSSTGTRTRSSASTRTGTDDPGEQYDPEGLEGKPELVVERENHNAVLDSGVVCKFSADYVDEENLPVLLDADYERLQEIGARIVEHERAFNNRWGFDRSDDTHVYAADLPGFEAALEEYYELRGWNGDGTVPDVDGGDAAVGAGD